MNKAEERQAQLMGDLTDIFNKTNLLRKPLMERTFAELSLSEIESLEVIGNIERPNVTKLADALYITRGAASKISKKLLSKGLIERYSLPENKKEVYFSLTEAGLAVNAKHEELHSDFLEQDRAVFEGFSAADLERVAEFVRVYKEHLDSLLKKKS